MNEPERLMDDWQHPEARALLEAGQKDGPPPKAVVRLLVSMGLAAASTGVTTTSAATALGTAKGTSGISLAMIAKLAGGSLVVGAVALASTLPSSTSTDDSKHGPAQVTFPLPAAVLPKVESGAAPPGPAEAPASSGAERKTSPTPRSDRPATRSRALSPARRTAEADPLTSEVALVGAARHALLRNAPGEALGLLNRHQREYPAGVLHPEAFVLRLEAMVLAGRRDAARALARKQLEKDPTGAHAQSIRKIAGE